MAEGTKLQMTFETAVGTRTWTFNYAKPGMTVANVKALGQAMVENGAIYETIPLILKSAKKVTTTEDVYDLT